MDVIILLSMQINGQKCENIKNIFWSLDIGFQYCNVWEIFFDFFYSPDPDPAKTRTLDIGPQEKLDPKYRASVKL